MYYVVLLKRIYCMIYADAFVSQKQETYEPYYYCNVHTISTQPLLYTQNLYHFSDVFVGSEYKAHALFTESCVLNKPGH